MERRSKERVIEMEIYTDGSLKKSGRSTYGGWAFVVIHDSQEIYHDFGSEYNTTNQRMELTAILKALEYAKTKRRGSERVVVYSDSAYAINCYLKE